MDRWELYFFSSVIKVARPGQMLVNVNNQEYASFKLSLSDYTHFDWVELSYI